MYFKRKNLLFVNSKNVVYKQAIIQYLSAGFYEDPFSGTRRRAPYTAPASPPPCTAPTTDPRTQWKRLLLLIVAITVHNIPEGLAVGVGNAAIGSTPSATYQSARYVQ